VTEGRNGKLGGSLRGRRVPIRLGRRLPGAGRDEGILPSPERWVVEQRHCFLPERSRDQAGGEDLLAQFLERQRPVSCLGGPALKHDRLSMGIDLGHAGLVQRRRNPPANVVVDAAIGGPGNEAAPEVPDSGAVRRQDGVEVRFFEQNEAARLHGGGEPFRHVKPLGNVVQQRPRADEIVSLSNRVFRNVELPHFEVRSREPVQKSRVDIGGSDVPTRSDLVGEPVTWCRCRRPLRGTSSLRAAPAGRGGNACGDPASWT
jgi:hypothetical protein